MILPSAAWRRGNPNPCIMMYYNSIQCILNTHTVSFGLLLIMILPSAAWRRASPNPCILIYYNSIQCIQNKHAFLCLLLGMILPSAAWRRGSAARQQNHVCIMMYYNRITCILNLHTASFVCCSGMILPSAAWRRGSAVRRSTPSGYRALRCRARPLTWRPSSLSCQTRGEQLTFDFWLRVCDGGGGCASGGVPLGAVPVLSWCGEVTRGGIQSSSCSVCIVQ